MSESGHDAFLSDAERVIGRVRQALTSLFESVGTDPSRPGDVVRRFELDKTLAWRLARVVTDDRLTDAASHLPRRPSFQIVADKLARHRAPPERIAAMFDALDEYERVVERHAGDRDRFEVMVGGSSAKTSARKLETLRRSAYLANSAIWGVCTSVHIAARFVLPSRTPGRLDIATVCGMIGFRRLRADVPWVIAAAYAWGETLRGDTYRPLPIDPAAPDDTPLIPSACSAPLPRITAQAQGPREVRYVLGEGPVGNTAASDVLFGWRRHDDVSASASFAGEVGEHAMRVTTPTEHLVHDLFIHRSLEFAVDPHGSVYGHLPGGHPVTEPGATAPELPVPAPVVALRSDDPLFTRGAPHYARLLNHATSCLGVSRSDLAVYRCQIAYPPMPTLCLIRHSLLPHVG